MAFKFKPTDEYTAAEATRSADENNLRNFQTYTPSTYQQSADLKNMWNTISNWEVPTWDRENNTWWNKLTSTMNDIENREKFSYDVNGDALYQQYKDQYVNLGKMASADVMGQASAMTGGYGNSYAQTVGQQTYQGYLQQLTDKIPELYQIALSKYNSEGEELYNRLGAYGNLYNTEYGEHRDTVADSKDQLSHYTNLYGIKSNEEYGQWYDNEQLQMAANEQAYKKLADMLGISTDLAKTLYDRAYQGQFDEYSTGYQESRDEVADQQWLDTFIFNKDQAGIANDQWEREFQYGKDRDEVADQQWQKTFAETKSTNARKYSYDDDEDEEEVEVDDVDYSTWSALDWNSYFSIIRQEEGQQAATETMTEFVNNGILPKKFVAAAAAGVRGGKWGH